MSTGLRTDALETATTPESLGDAPEEAQDSPDDAHTPTATPPIHEGLAGVVIGRSKICAVNGQQGTLSYRGYDIGELACHATFEETVYLLWHGDLPTQEQLTDFTQRLAAEREIDDTAWHILSLLPPSVDPMDALRTAVSALSAAEEGTDQGCADASEAQAVRLVAKVPTIIAAYYRHQQGLARVHPNPELSHAANFLYMIRNERSSETTVASMDLAMLLMAEHGYNASTFAARVTAATLADMYAAVTTAVGTLKGPLHGGANRRAMQMMLEIGEAANVERFISDLLARKERIMGFGHRVYRTAPDPRSAYLRGRLYEICAERDDFHFYELATTIAETVEAKKGLYPNVDFYAAPVLYLLGIPLALFVPVFAASRVPGWTAHVMEQQAHNRIIRPLSAYVGPENRTYLPIEQR